MKISVIVPVYNVEKYLYKCILSIINQTYKDLEIILVDDGSTDSSSIVCDELKMIDNRIKVIHKVNGGLSSARNAGIEISTGELLSFIDSDDWIEPDFLEVLHNGIIVHNADISAIQLIKVVDFNNIEFNTKTQIEWILYNRNEAMKTLFTKNIIKYSACNKLYRKELFIDIRYPEGMLNEDKATIYKLVHNSNLIVVNLSQKYHYYLRQNSIMNSKFNIKNFDSFQIHEEMIEFIDDNYPQLFCIVRARYVHASIRMLLMMIRSNYINNTDFNRCIEIIQKNKKFVYKESNIQLLTKFLTLIISIFPNIPFFLAKSKMVSGILKKTKIS